MLRVRNLSNNGNNMDHVSIERQILDRRMGRNVYANKMETTQSYVLLNLTVIFVKTLFHIMLSFSS